MKYIVHKDGSIVMAYEADGYSLEYAGYETVAVALDGELWRNVVDNPEKYVYKDGAINDLLVTESNHAD